MKIKIHFILGRISDNGYKQFDLASLHLGSNGFSIVVLGILIIVRFNNKKQK